MTKIYFILYLFKIHIKTKSDFRLALFERFALYNELIFKNGVVIYTGAAASFFPYPAYMYFFENEKVPLLSMYIPGIDETTFTGHMILIMLQVPLLIMAIVGLTSCDIMYAMLIINIPILARIIEDEVNQLNELLGKESFRTHVLRFRFRNLLLVHREMCELVRKLVNTKSFTFFFSFFSLFSDFWVNWRKFSLKL